MNLSKSTDCGSNTKSAPSIPIPDLDFIQSTSINLDYSEPLSLSQPFFSKRENLILPALDMMTMIPRISHTTLVDLLQGVYDQLYDLLYIFDCRFNYEYVGGHVKNAQNITKSSELSSFFDTESKKKCLFVFHCEYSHNRGPAVAQLFRELDRQANISKHPFIFYPDVYVLYGGYRLFYGEHPDLCEGGFRPMSDPPFVDNGECRRAMSVFKKEFGELSLKNKKRPLITCRSQDYFNSPPLIHKNGSCSPLASRFFSQIDL